MKKQYKLEREKARSLVQYFFNQTDHIQWEEAKTFAIKVCDEMLNEGIIVMYDGAKNVREFWVKVKEEIIDNL